MNYWLGGYICESNSCRVICLVIWIPAILSRYKHLSNRPCDRKSQWLLENLVLRQGSQQPAHQRGRSVGEILRCRVHDWYIWRQKYANATWIHEQSLLSTQFLTRDKTYISCNTSIEVDTWWSVHITRWAWECRISCDQDIHAFKFI